MEKVAVIVTVLNEENSIENLLMGLINQTQRPDDIIIVDGGSTDSTLTHLKKWSHKIKLFIFKGNRSQGRNFGVSKSKSSILAFTDAGCVPDPNWVENLTKPFSDKSVKVVSGYYRGNPKTVFEQCLVPYVLVMPEAANKTEFFPSTRSMAIRKNEWIKSGGFDESLSHNEDYAYAHKLKSLGFSFTFAPNAIVSWTPRSNLIQAIKMFFRFAYGDIEANILRSTVRLLAIRYLVSLFIFFFLWEINRLFSITFLLLSLFIVGLWAIWKNYRYVKSFYALFWLPLIQLSADLSILFGSLTALLNKAYT